MRTEDRSHDHLFPDLVLHSNSVLRPPDLENMTFPAFFQKDVHDVSDRRGSGYRSGGGHRRSCQALRARIGNACPLKKTAEVGQL